MWNAASDGGINLEKSEVTFFRRLTECCIDAALVGDKPLLEQYSEQAFKLGDFFKKFFQRGPVKKQEFRIFERVNIVFTRFARQNAIGIAYPPILYCKLYNVLFTFVIYRVTSKATFGNKGAMPGNIAGLQEELVLAEFFWNKKCGTVCEFFFCKLDPFQYMCT